MFNALIPSSQISFEVDSLSGSNDILANCFISVHSGARLDVNPASSDYENYNPTISKSTFVYVNVRTRLALALPRNAALKRK